MTINIKLPTIRKEGFFAITVICIATILISFLSTFFGLVGLVLTVGAVYFFRDPKRTTCIADNLIIAPADGRIIKVEESTPPRELDIADKMLKVSIFMNVFNVHVNRMPASGTITRSIYHPGKFVNASFDKASEDNERHTYLMENNNKDSIIFVQIAGLIARRIVPFVKEEDTLKAGERFGMIKFGSRVDVYLPLSMKENLMVNIGQQTLAGETILVDTNKSFKNTEFITK